MQVKTLICLGRASVGLAAAAAGDLVPLGQLTVLLSGTAPLVHPHRASDITDLSTAIASQLWNLLEDTDSLTWSDADGLLSARVQLKPGGGIVSDASGLFIDDTVVSLPGHQHVAAEITDFQSVFTQSLAAALQSSSSVHWVLSGSNVTPVVQLAPGGALVNNGDGLEVDVGPSSTQVAAGDHAHPELHPAVTVQSSSSLALNIDATQALSAEVLIGTGLILNSGVMPDFGGGHNQVARGDHTHPGLASALVVGATPTVKLTYDGTNLSADVKLDPSPGVNAGVLGSTSNGFYVQLGSGTNMAAAGNHTHSTATASAAGFMSAADKVKLDALNNGAAVPTSVGQDSLLIVLDGAGQAIGTGLYEYAVLPYSGMITGWDLVGLPSGTLAVDIYKGAWGALPLTVAQSLTQGNKPQYAAGAGVRQAQAAGLNWTFNAGDVLGFNVDSCTVTRRATLGLRITKT